MAADGLLRSVHRVIAALFLLSIPPASYVSFTGDATSPWVYVPLFPLLGLTLTGTYMLVRPWVQRWRARPRSRAPMDDKETFT